MRLQDEGMLPELCKDPRTDLYSSANNFPVVMCREENFFLFLILGIKIIGIKIVVFCRSVELSRKSAQVSSGGRAFLELFYLKQNTQKL